MKIPSLCDVYPSFSHIRCRSVYNLPPHSSYSRMRAAWSQRLTADEREDRTAKMVMKQGKDGKRQEFPAGDSDHLLGPVLPSDHAGPHVHGSLWRRCVGGCSGSAMGRDHLSR